jgi:hypothetical protein
VTVTSRAEAVAGPGHCTRTVPAPIPITGVSASSPVDSGMQPGPDGSRNRPRTWPVRSPYPGGPSAPYAASIGAEEFVIRVGLGAAPYFGGAGSDVRGELVDL